MAKTCGKITSDKPPFVTLSIRINWSNPWFHSIDLNRKSEDWNSGAIFMKCCLVIVVFWWDVSKRPNCMLRRKGKSIIQFWMGYLCVSWPIIIHQSTMLIRLSSHYNPLVCRIFFSVNKLLSPLTTFPNYAFICVISSRHRAIYEMLYCVNDLLCFLHHWLHFQLILLAAYWFGTWSVC